MGVPASIPAVQSHRRGRRVKPSRLVALTTACPGPASIASISVTVLNFGAACATARSTASGEPRERNSVATCVPTCRCSVCSPTRRANVGSSVWCTPAASNAHASSSEIQLSMSSRYDACRVVAACFSRAATAASPPAVRMSPSKTLVSVQQMCRSASSGAAIVPASMGTQL